jgi:hypothetical protein
MWYTSAQRTLRLNLMIEKDGLRDKSSLIVLITIRLVGFYNYPRKRSTRDEVKK